MHQRVGVHHLDGASGSEGVFAGASTGFGSGESQDGTKTFPSGEDRVAHGLMDRPGRDRDLGEEIVEGVVDEFELAFEVVFEFGHARNVRMKF